jgi:hypothetical protein
MGIGGPSGAAGSWVYCCCTNGTCGNRVATAAVYIDAVSTAPVFPDALLLLSQPQASASDQPLAPITVALSGALTQGALYR